MTKTVSVESIIIQLTKDIADNFTMGIVKMAKVVCIRHFFSDVDKNGPESNEDVLIRWNSYHKYVDATPDIGVDVQYMDSLLEAEQNNYPGLPLVVVTEYEYHSIQELDTEIQSLYGSIISTAYHGGLLSRDAYLAIMQDV